MKNYKKQITIVSNCFALLLIALAFCAADTFAQRRTEKTVDIFCRPALYFGDSVLNAQPVNGKSRYVTAGKKIVLTPADSFANQNGIYSFNMMYILYGSPMNKVESLGEFANRLRIGSQIVNQHTIGFANADGGNNDTKIKYVRTQINLPIGTSVIALSLDDDKKVAEGNENNNSHTFTVEVVSKP